MARVGGVVLLLLLAAVQLSELKPFIALQNAYIDFQQSIIPSPLPAAPITIVDIDERSIAALGQWPWPRDRIAELITALGLDEAAVVGVNIVFSEPDRLSPENALKDMPVSQALLDELAELSQNDDAVAESMRLVPTVLATGIIPEEVAPRNLEQSTPTPIKLSLDWRSAARLNRYPALLKSLPKLEAASAGSGVASIELGQDGIIRRLPTVMLVGAEIVPSFGVEIMRNYRKASAIGIEMKGFGIDGLQVGTQEIPTDPAGNIWLRHISQDKFMRLSAVDVLLGNHAHDEIHDRIIVLGATGAGLERTFISTGGVLTSALDLHALFVENLVSDIFLIRSQVQFFFELLATLAGCLGIMLLHGRLRTYPGQLAVLIYVACLISISIYMMAFHRILFDPSFAVVAIVACYLGFIGSEIVKTQHERRQTAAERETALMLAEAASRSKTNFLASMSHELRTPLNAILGFSEMIKDGALGPVTPSKYVDYASDIHGSAGDLLGMVTEILEMATLEAGETKLTITDFDLKDAIVESIMAIGSARNQADTAILFDDRIAMPHLRADRNMVKRILLNLLQNAVKFSPAGGSVRIAGKYIAKGEYAISVIDTGSGMNRQQVAEAFEIFHNVDQSKSDSARGIGLGLPIATAQMALHDGRVGVTSGENKGTTVTLYFPARRVLRSSKN